MTSPRILLLLVASFVLHQTSLCLPNVRQNITQGELKPTHLERSSQRGGIEESTKHFVQPPRLEDHQSNALFIRSKDNSTRGRMVYKDLTFLDPLDSHALGLYEMHFELRTVVAAAAEYYAGTIETIADVYRIAFKYGAFLFTIGYSAGVASKGDLLRAAVGILEALMIATCPVTFSLVLYGSVGITYWATGFFEWTSAA